MYLINGFEGTEEKVLIEYIIATVLAFAFFVIFLIALFIIRRSWADFVSILITGKTRNELQIERGKNTSANAYQQNSKSKDLEKKNDGLQQPLDVAQDTTVSQESNTPNIQTRPAERTGHSKNDEDIENTTIAVGNVRNGNLNAEKIPVSYSAAKVRHIPTVIGDDRPTVLQAFIIHSVSGIMISSMSFSKENNIDPDIMAGMLTALREFIADTVSTDQKSKQKAPAAGLTAIKYSMRHIVIEKGINIFIAVVMKGKDDTGVRRAIRQALIEIRGLYPWLWVEWDGDISKFKGMDKIIRHHLKQYIMDYKE
ncbi:MAG: hypothetical protein QW728_02960, partial [Thermoplasmata archaeon]